MKSSDKGHINRLALIVVDIQKDFCAGGSLEVPGAESLIHRLNAHIASVYDAGSLLVFTRDWHPKNHRSFLEFGGQWPVHCVQNTLGAEFHADLVVPQGSRIVSTGFLPEQIGYSPFDDPEMPELIGSSTIKVVYVTGIALEYCVRATCLDLLGHGKQVIAIEPLIRSISINPTVVEAQWAELVDAGVVRAREVDCQPGGHETDVD